jgi:SAM-dependent methyltransferase
MSSLPPNFNMIERVGGRWASLCNRLDDWLTERRLGIRTTGSREVNVADAVDYSTFAYAGIGRVLDRLELRADDVFVEVGCGKGRVVCAAALRPVQRVIGIDLDAELCRAARANADRLRPPHAAIEIVHRPAQEFDYREGTVVFMFNPFNRGPLLSVLEAIKTQRLPIGEVRIVSVNPRFDATFAEFGGFERYDHWPLRPGDRLKFAVSFWRGV